MVFEQLTDEPRPVAALLPGDGGTGGNSRLPSCRVHVVQQSQHGLRHPERRHDQISRDRRTIGQGMPEARVPFTDPDLTEYLSRVPSRLKLPGLKQKHLMRTALRGILPDAIITKKKVGLEMPYSRWMKRELRDVVDNYLSRERVTASGLFDPAGIERLVAAHMEGRVDHGRALWGLLNYMMWLDLYM